MGVESLRSTFACTRFTPYWNANMPSMDHLLAFEVCWAICAVLHLVLAVKTRRVWTYVGILAYAVVLETVGFLSQSHAHNQFRVQLTCYLPLKEVLYYGSTMFVPLVVAEYSPMPSLVQKAVLAMFIGSLQNVLLEMVNAHSDLGNVYMNVDDFQYADYSDKMNGAIVAVVVSMGAFIFMGALIALGTKPSFFQVILIPALGFIIGAPLQMLLFVIKYIGCLHFVKAEPTLYEFHVRCVSYSTISNYAVLLCHLSIGLLFVCHGINGMKTSKRTELDSLSKIMILLASLICHGTIIYNLLEGAQLMSIEVPNQVVIYMAISVLHIGLIHCSLEGGLLPFTKLRSSQGNQAKKQKRN